MLKNILKIEGVNPVSKSGQKEVNGGELEPIPFQCSILCVYAASGTSCIENGHCHGKCDGNGGFQYL